VASFLFPDGRPGPGKLYLRAAGSEEPAASEFSEAGRAANRRVEILILD
jgi:outer membrane protein OmpA-like peptidoglycan-associated protein